MARIILLALGLLLCFSLSGQQIIDQINFDGTDNPDITIAIVQPGECDGVAGTFGEENGAFVISESEGLACCPCFPGGANECGTNNNFASITGIQPVILFCNISIEAVVSFSGSLECGSPVGECGLDGGDAMKIDVLLGGQRVELGSFCGTQQRGTFRLDNLSAGDMDFIAFEIQGGTQDSDEAYSIESITIRGFPVPLVPVDIMVPPGSPDTLCSGVDPLFLLASGAANDQYIWTLENDMGVVSTLSETGATIQRPTTMASDGGIYRATVNDPSNPCNNSVAVRRVIVADCSAPVPDFTNSLRTIFCRDTDILSYPNTDNNGVPGTWNFSDNLVLADTTIFNEVIFTPDPSTGFAPFVQQIRIDAIPILGSFPLSNTLELCIFNDPVQRVDFVSELGLVSNDILNINFNGNNIFSAAELVDFNVTSITPGSYPINFEFGPFGACGIVDTTVIINLNKIDRVDDVNIPLCANDIDIQDFTQLLPNSANPAGTWTDIDNSGLDISNPSLVDASLLTPGRYRFQYSVSCGNLMDSAVLILDVTERPSRVISPPDLCEGDGFSLTFPSGNVYDETIPFGMETVPSTSGGCDSLITIDLQFISRPTRFVDPPNLCAGDTVSFLGVDYVRTDQIDVDVPNPAGICDSIVTLNLIFRTQPVDTRTITNGLCEGVPFMFEGVSYDRDTVVNVETTNPNPNECDSLLIVFLNFQTGPTRTIAPTNLCIGSTFTFNNVTYTQDTVAEIPITNPFGCDSLITLDLTFNPQPRGTRVPSGLCSGMPFIVDGVSYDRDTIFEITVTNTNPDPNICDSIVTVDLQFGTGPTRTIANSDLCADSPFTFDGVTYTSDTLTTVNVNNPAGCDSLITLDLTFQPIGTRTISPDLCEGDPFSVSFNGNVYDETNLSGTESVTAPNGCDSIITIDLVFKPNAELLINNVGTVGDGFEVVVDGVTYNEANPSDVITLTASNGCDSIITVDLVFVNRDAVFDSLIMSACTGDGFFATGKDGIIYDESNPTGIDTFQTADGRDSIFITQLTFLDPGINSVSSNHVAGDGFEITINGITYDESNPMGNDTLVGGAANNCDSIIMVDLIFVNTAAVFDSLIMSACSGDGFFTTGKDGIIYDEDNPSGIDTFQTADGRDSIFITRLTFLDLGTNSVSSNHVIGDGFEIMLNGITYDESNPMGRDTIVGGAANNCDSIIIVDLIFSNTATVFDSLIMSACSGDGFFTTGKDGIIYDEDNPSGIDTFQTADGRDSIFITRLTFLDLGTNSVSSNHVIGDGFEIMLNGITYDESNPMGRDTIVGGAANNCDSIIIVDLIFSNTATVFDSLIMSACSGDGFFTTGKDGIIYDEDNPSGIDTFQTTDGRDSIFITRLTFLDPGINSVSSTQATGDGFEITLNGITYDETNPMGRDTIVGGAANTCDSIIIVNLDFEDAIRTTFDTILCSGDGFSRMIGNSIYDETNPVGIDTFMTAAGLDSFVFTSLMFEGPRTGVFMANRCIGDGFNYPEGTTSFNEARPTGDTTIVGGASNGCDSIITVMLTFTNEILEDNMDNICPGMTVTVGNSIYGETTSLSGMDTFMTAAGCDSIVRTELTIDSILIEFSVMDLCVGTNMTSVEIINLKPNLPLNVLLDGRDFSLTDTIVLPIDVSVQNDLIVSNQNGCSITPTIEVMDAEAFMLEIIDEELAGDTVQLSFAFDGVVSTAIWSATDGTACVDCDTINVSSNQQNTYTLTVTDELGCTYEESIDIAGGGTTVIPTPDPATFYVSNTFSPSGSTGNDRLYLSTADQDIVSYDLTVFDRWGNKIYDQVGLTPNDSQSGWDGMGPGNQEVRTGVYIYKVELVRTTGSIEIAAGDVLLLN